jgi:hypothetical protein
MGWLTPATTERTSLAELSVRPAKVIELTHDLLADGNALGTLSCSGGSVATFTARVFHGIDPLLDYQMIVGGPVIFDVGASCGARGNAGRCELDPHRRCRTNLECGGGGICARYDHGLFPNSSYTEVTDLDMVVDSIYNTGSACQNCDGCGPIPLLSGTHYRPFDPSQDWVTEHDIDFVLNVQDFGSDAMLGVLPHARDTFEALETAGDAVTTWSLEPGHHCEAIGMDATADRVAGMLMGASGA